MCSYQCKESYSKFEMLFLGFQTILKCNMNFSFNSKLYTEEKLARAQNYLVKLKKVIISNYVAYTHFHMVSLKIFERKKIQYNIKTRPTQTI